MKKIFLFSLLLFGSSILLAQDAPKIKAETPSSIPLPSLALDLGWYSRDLNKGLVVNPDPVLKLDADIRWFGIYYHYTAYTDMTGFNNADQNHGYTNDRRYRFEEEEHSIGYAYTLQNFKLSPITLKIDWEYDKYGSKHKNTRYDKTTGTLVKIPGKDHSRPHTKTLHLGLDFDNFFAKESRHALGLGFLFAFENETRGWNGNIHSTYRYKFTDKLTGAFEVVTYWREGTSNHKHVVYSDYVDSFHFNTVTFTPSMTYQITKWMFCKVYATGAYGLGAVRDAQAANGINNKENFMYGTSLGFRF